MSLVPLRTNALLAAAVPGVTPSNTPISAVVIVVVSSVNDVSPVIVPVTAKLPLEVIAPHSSVPSAVIAPEELIVTPLEPVPPAISKSPLSSTLKTSVPSYCLNTKSSLSTNNFIITSPAVSSKSKDN